MTCDIYDNLDMSHRSLSYCMRISPIMRIMIWRSYQELINVIILLYVHVWVNCWCGELLLRDSQDYSFALA